MVELDDLKTVLMFSSLRDPMLKKIAEVTLVTEFSAGSYIFKEVDATLDRYADLPKFRHLQNYGDLHRANMNRAFTEFESQ